MAAAIVGDDAKTLSRIRVRLRGEDVCARRRGPRDKFAGAGEKSRTHTAGILRFWDGIGGGRRLGASDFKVTVNIFFGKNDSECNLNVVYEY